jgi:hypothetical protein
MVHALYISFSKWHIRGSTRPWMHIQQQKRRRNQCWGVNSLNWRKLRKFQISHGKRILWSCLCENARINDAGKIGPDESASDEPKTTFSPKSFCATMIGLSLQFPYKLLFQPIHLVIRREIELSETSCKDRGMTVKYVFYPVIYM